MDRQKLVEDNFNLVYEVAHKYKYLCCTVLSFDDLVSVGSIGLVRASQVYDDTKNIKFSTLAFTCIKNAILRESINRQYRFNHTNTVSFNSKLFVDEYKENIELQDVVRDTKMEAHLNNLDNKILIDSIYTRCTEREKKVIDLYLAGYTIKDISVKLGCYWVTVNNIIRGLKKYIGGEAMKLNDIETVCPYCFSKLEDNITGKTHIKYCKDCSRWWKTYTKEED